MNKILVILIIFCILGCKKSDPGTVASGSKSVYVVGAEINGGNYTAIYWKDGVVTRLTDGTKDAVATCIDDSGGDVYVGGFESNGTNYVAKYLPIFLHSPKGVMREFDFAR